MQGRAADLRSSRPIRSIIDRSRCQKPAHLSGMNLPFAGPIMRIPSGQTSLINRARSSEAPSAPCVAALPLASRTNMRRSVPSRSQRVATWRTSAGSVGSSGRLRPCPGEPDAGARPLSNIPYSNRYVLIQTKDHRNAWCLLFNERSRMTQVNETWRSCRHVPMEMKQDVSWLSAVKTD